MLARRRGRRGTTDGCRRGGRRAGGRPRPPYAGRRRCVRRARRTPPGRRRAGGSARRSGRPPRDRTCPPSLVGQPPRSRRLAAVAMARRATPLGGHGPHHSTRGATFRHAGGFESNPGNSSQMCATICAGRTCPCPRRGAPEMTVPTLAVPTRGNDFQRRNGGMRHPIRHPVLVALPGDRLALVAGCGGRTASASCPRPSRRAPRRRRSTLPCAVDGIDPTDLDVSDTTGVLTGRQPQLRLPDLHGDGCLHRAHRLRPRWSSCSTTRCRAPSRSSWSPGPSPRTARGATSPGR